MYFTEVKDAPKFYKKTKLYSILSDFKNSGIKYARVEDWKYATCNAGVNAINKSAKRYKFNGIHAFYRKGEIFLINENL
jgi:hypothetical protein